MRVPCLLIVLLHVPSESFEAQVGLSNALAEPVSGGERFWLRSTALGWLQALLNPALTRPFARVGIGLVVRGGLLIWWSHCRRSILLLFVVWLLPFGAAPFIWSLSPQAHPRYLLPFIPPGFLCADMSDTTLLHSLGLKAQ